MPKIDDDTVAYVLETRKYFEDFRQVTAQLAGLLVLTLAGGKTATLDNPLIEISEQLFANAFEGVRRAHTTLRARHHHHLLLQAAAAIRTALYAVRGGTEIDPVLTPLRAAYARLEQAANTLPGFEMVAFEQGCCATHRGSRR